MATSRASSRLRPRINWPTAQGCSATVRLGRGRPERSPPSASPTGPGLHLIFGVFLSRRFIDTREVDGSSGSGRDRPQFDAGRGAATAAGDEEAGHGGRRFPERWGAGFAGCRRGGRLWPCVPRSLRRGSRRRRSRCRSRRTRWCALADEVVEACLLEAAGAEHVAAGQGGVRGGEPTCRPVGGVRVRLRAEGRLVADGAPAGDVDQFAAREVGLVRERVVASCVTNAWMRRPRPAPALSAVPGRTDAPPDRRTPANSVPRSPRPARSPPRPVLAPPPGPSP